jgi:hypothetical protein
MIGVTSLTAEQRHGPDQTNEQTVAGLPERRIDPRYLPVK